MARTVSRVREGDLDARALSKAGGGVHVGALQTGCPASGVNPLGRGLGALAALGAAEQGQEGEQQAAGLTIRALTIRARAAGWAPHMCVRVHVLSQPHLPRHTDPIHSSAGGG